MSYTALDSRGNDVDTWYDDIHSRVKLESPGLPEAEKKNNNIKIQYNDIFMNYDHHPDIYIYIYREACFQHREDRC